MSAIFKLSHFYAQVAVAAILSLISGNDLLGVGKRYLTMTSKQSIQFFHTFLIIKYASNMQYILLVVCGLFLTVKFSSLFTAVAILACLKSLYYIVLNAKSL